MKRIDPKGFDSEMKSAYHLEVYEELFEHLVDKEIRLLELGIYQGKSLLLYRDYFEKGRIIGLDMNPIQIDDSTGRIRTYVGYQQDIALLNRIAQEEAPDGFDVIIDDCSHIAEPTRIAFWHLFVNHLKPGGIYAIEDIGTAFIDDFPDGGRYKMPRLPRQFSSSSSSKPSQVHVPVSLVASVSPSIKRLLPGAIVQSLNHSKKFNRLYERLSAPTSPYRYKKRRVPSHMEGMVGFVKELIDVCAHGDGIGGARIHKIQISLNQAIVIKSKP
jgi:hypothetical protein